MLNWAVLRAVLAERAGIRLPRSVVGAARGVASSRGSWDHPGLHRQQALALHFLARELAGAADSFRLLPRFLFRGFLVMAAELHLAEDALALLFLLQHLEGLVDIVVTDENLHTSFLFNPADDSVSFPRRPGRARAFFVLKRLEVHAAHSAHASTGTARHRWALLLRQLGHHRLGGNQQARDGGRVLQRGPHDFGRVDDALRYQVAVLAGLCVVAEGVGVLFQDLADHDRAVLAGVDRDLARRPGDRLADDLDAGLLVVVVGAYPLQGLARAQQRNAAARQDTFLDRRAGCMHGVIDAVLALLHLDLGRAADAEHCDPAGELGQSLLQLLPVVVGGRFLDLRLDLGNASLDVGLLAGAADDRSVFLVDHHLLGPAKHIDCHVLE